VEQSQIHSNVAILRTGQQILERPRLDRLFEKAMRFPCVTVVAGAGYGKTQAVYSFLRNYKAVVTWLQLSERDNLRRRFWENFTQTISFHNPRLAAQLTEIGLPDTDRKFERFMALPAENAVPGMKYLFVYDDFHLLRDRAVLRFIRRSVLASFPSVTSILISRQEPDIDPDDHGEKKPAFRIGEEDLRFGQEEIIAYFDRLGIGISSGMAADIRDDTEGWAFAIHLLALTIKRGPAETAYARAAMKLNVFKLIENEIWNRLSPELGKFLIKLSLIDHLSLELLKQMDPDRKLTGEMMRIGSFIRYDVYQASFHIHHLFGEYLTEKQEELTGEEKRETYARTAVWCAGNGLNMDALTYYEKAGDYDGVVNIGMYLSQVIPMDTGGYMLEIFNRAPEELFRKNAAAGVVLVRTMLSLGRFEEAVNKAMEFIDMYEKQEPTDFSCRLLSGSYNNLGFWNFVVCNTTRNYEFPRYFERGDHYSRLGSYVAQGPVTSVSVSTFACRVASAEKGEIDVFIAALEAAVPYVMHSMNGCMYGLDDLCKAEYAFFRAALPESEGFVNEALRKAGEKRQYDIEHKALFYLMRIALARGDRGKLEDIIARLRAQLDREEYTNRNIMHDTAQGWFYAHIGVTDRIARWLKNDFEESDLNSLIAGMETEVRAKYQLAEKKYPMALASVNNEENRFGMKYFIFGRITMKCLEAVCLYRNGETAAAIEALEEAYAMTAPNGLDMFFIELGKDMRVLAGAALREGTKVIPQDWLRKILNMSAGYAKKIFVIAEKYGTKQGKEAEGGELSGREREILMGLSRGLTRKELAGDLSLSVNTVKSVIKSIYNKLGAVNLADAVRIAASMKILENGNDGSETL
jgi:LuxR family maltose regulon positive regulatory protein